MINSPNTLSNYKMLILKNDKYTFLILFVNFDFFFFQFVGNGLCNYFN